MEAIAQAMSILDRSSTPEAQMARAELRKAVDVLQETIMEEATKNTTTVQTATPISGDDREQRIKDRHAGLVEAWGSTRFGGAQPTSSLPDAFLERIARMEVDFESYRA